MTRQIIFKLFYDLRPVAATATATVAVAASACAPTVSEVALQAGGETIDKPNQTKERT